MMGSRGILLQLEGWEAVIVGAMIAGAVVLAAVRGITIRQHYRDESDREPPS